jgi:peptidoglycan/LPS O-acetylase OafA/YrhL
MPELDTLRGVAILGVVFLHGIYSSTNTLHFDGHARRLIQLTQPGWLGVNLFFVLSGFLITGILLDSKASARYFSTFYTRRALRILPAYYALLILLAIVGHSSWTYLGLCFIYLANVTTLFGVVEDYGPLWSLAVEEHYYLIWPLVVRYLSRRQVGAVATLICALTAVLRALAFHAGYVSGLGSFTWLVADGLAFGSLLAALVRGPLSRSQLWGLSGLTIILGTMAGLFGKPFGIMTRDRLLGAAFQYTVIHVIFTGILLLFLLIGTSRWRGLVNIGWLRFFGFISYGLYLIHLLAFRLYDRLCRSYAPSFLLTSGRSDLLLLRFAVAGCTAVAVAYLSRVYFEDYFLRLKQKLTR